MSAEAAVEPGEGAAAASEVVLSARDVVKTYGGTRALKGVNFDVHRGTVTTLFGENGAGKSTLMKILSGVEKPTSGTIELDGEPVSFADTNDARDRGISIIHQELSLAPNLSVRDNMFMGRELRGPTGIDYREEERRTREVLQELSEQIDPLTPVSDLRLGQQQLVEIARALRITDHAVVLRDGTMTANALAEDIDLEWIVRRMVGDDFDLGAPPDTAFGDVALSVQDIVVTDVDNPDRSVVDHLSLDVRAGEIVCIYGLMGAGRTELLESLAGRVPMASGRVLVEGADFSRLPIRERIARGLGLVPEDRQRDGLVQTMSVGANLSLASVTSFVRGLFLSRPAERRIVDDGIRDVHVKTSGGTAAIGSLSGGNQQKVVIGKIVATGPKVILLDEPSRGIDVGAKAEVFRLLAERAREGLAVVYSTSEVGECLSIAHRVVVMRRGRIAAEFGPATTKEEIMAASGEAVVA